MRRDPTHIVMAGTSFATRGGVSAVVNAYRAAGLFERWPIDYIETHCDGSAIAKFACALRAFFAMLVLIVRHPHAVLHVHAASRASFWRKCVFMTLARLAGWPVVFHLHGGGFARFYEDECGPLGRRVVRFFLDHAARIVVLSQRWSVWMRSVTSNPRVVCIPNPVTLGPSPRPSAFNPAPEGPRGEGEQLVAFVGRCEAAKGIFELLEAVSELRSAFPAVRLECAGDGDLEAVQRRAAELGMRSRVSLPGWIGPQQREALLSRAAVFVLPSHAEGMPMSLLEAMAAGCPVVASDVGGIPDIVTHGVNGLLVPVGDPEALAAALHRVLADRELAGRLGKAAREAIAREYTAEHALERLEQIYAGLGARRTTAGPVPLTQRLQEIA